jgi:hypothetical protein
MTDRNAEWSDEAVTGATTQRAAADVHLHNAPAIQKVNSCNTNGKLKQSQSWRNLLPPGMIEQLQRRFSPMRVEYIARVLTAGEIGVLCDIGDALIIARIKRMPNGRLCRYDACVPVDLSAQRKFCDAQLEWIRGEHYLLGTRLGRSPTHAELFADFVHNRNGLRFRAYYCMKHPSQMKRKVACEGAASAACQSCS